ncbi:MAG: Glu-tRNA(Gln) amidotransferase subunit GatE [Nanoarchaeota archaeon]|nr:Glu-tRNA(Gln) amidotransferase subunit GatE [Nanoarchaeota archaeon]MBU1974256.1 Glu-tRNA(Gln) amidotransferase subunit GatE [Nanoarchaeota archaeon]
MDPKIGLKCGLEIHQQLEGKKLFCDCPTQLRDDQPDFEIRRKLRAVAGEHGEIDVAALQEQLKGKEFVYQGYHKTTCLVETDSEPPHALNQDALYTTLQLSKLVEASVSPIVQVMRKTVVDGSNTSGFQRTALIARKGLLKTSQGEVRIDNISLEEDACKIISENHNQKVYRLDKLGIPMIEIGTAPDIKTPQQCKETSEKLGMLLRSLPGVKRGLGTIRQDVNVSIKGGVRIEFKGVQDLRMIPTIIELEVKRQQELLKLKEELRHVRLDKLEVVELNTLLQDTTAKIMRKTLESEGKILGMKMSNFAGLLGRELQPGYCLGTEFSGRAKVKAGVGGIFHSDELPNYGITESEVKLIKKKLKCTPHDGFVLIADKEEKSRRALEAVYERAEELFLGVPKEVRKDLPDGTSKFMRPMPGAARMYPETDVPLIRSSIEVEIPELLEEKIKRYQKDFGLSYDLAKFISRSDRLLLFEEIVSKYKQLKPAFIAEILTSSLLEIKRKYQLDVLKLTDNNFRELFKYVDSDKISKDIVLDVLIDMIKGQFNLKNYQSLGTEEIVKVIEEIVAKNSKAPFGALMGMCMKQLAGKASGEFISSELKKFLDKAHQ